MIKMKAFPIVLGFAITSSCVGVTAQAAITSTNVAASMQILDQNNTPSFTSVGQTVTNATAASVDLTASDTPLHVQSIMTFSSLSAEFAVFDFLIGMHGNKYTGKAYLGTLGPSNLNGGTLHYFSSAPMTATVTYDYDISSPGTDVYGNPVTFGMLNIDVISPSHNWQLPGANGGASPAAGHYRVVETLNLTSGDNLFKLSFGPNVSGSPGWIDGQFDGSVTFNFGSAAPIPEPETYALMLAGLGLLGFAARRRKQKVA
jgi:hypothetical protein